MAGESLPVLARQRMRESKYVSASLLVAFLVSFPSFASAATLLFSPDTASVRVGDLVTASVMVTSANQAMNAVSDTMTFDEDLLQVVSVSKANSVLTLWVQDPSFSNTSGTVTFGGIVPDPGFTGSRGRIVSIQFRAKKAGVANLRFSSDAQVLANDGNGTDILTGSSPGAITISAVTSEPKVVVGGPAITSPTHPEQTSWYSSTAVELQWINAADTKNVRIGYDKVASGQPTVIYDASVSTKSLKLEEGVWYFHVQLQTANGWGPVSTFRLQIDTTPPNPIKIQFPNGSIFNNAQPVAVFYTTDDLSGIDRYVLKLGAGTPLRIPGSAVTNSPYPLPVQGPGQGSMEVVAYDRAGNSVTSQANFTVIGLNPPTLDPIADITVGDTLQITGTTYPNARIEVFLKNERGQSSSQVSQSDLNGAFRTIWKDSLGVGIYSATAQTTDSTGSKSTLSPEVPFQVKESSFSILGQLGLKYLSVAFLILCVLIALAFLIRYVWHHFHAFHNRLTQKLYGAKRKQIHDVLHEQIIELKEAIAEEVAALEQIKSKRDLTVEEERFVNRFQKMLDKSEEIIREYIDSDVR